MKTLHLLRHAKSCWDDPTLDDRDRPLNRRGQRDAPRMGKALGERLAPMAIACSPARRAQLTLAGLCQGWPELSACSHSSPERLYTFSYRELLDWLEGVPDAVDNLFIIGHNPALTGLANVLVGEDVLENLPTAGYLRLDIESARWAELAGAPAAIVEQLFPKAL